MDSRKSGNDSLAFRSPYPKLGLMGASPHPVAKAEQPRWQATAGLSPQPCHSAPLGHGASHPHPLSETGVNKHQDKRHGGGRGPSGQAGPVVGMKGRDGTVRAMPVEHTDMATLKAVVSEQVDLAATVYTDEFGGYNTIPQRRKTVCHSAGEYVRGQAHTNGIESFWALLKRVWVGTHHWWSRRHCFRYVAECAHRQNTMGLNGEGAIALLVQQAVGKRLTDAGLIGGW